MLQIIYESRAVEPFSSARLAELIAHAQKKNTEDGVTGLLIYHEHTFLQVLEGPDTAVRACYNRIKDDPRHTDFWQLAEFKLKHRAFNRWNMALADTSSVPISMEFCTRSLDDIRQRVRQMRESAPKGSGAYYTARVIRSFLQGLEDVKTLAS